MSSVEKLSNHVDSPVSRFRKLSVSACHIYNEYPLVTESVDWLLGVAFINYIATFISHVGLSFKNDLIDKLYPKIYSTFVTFDEWFTKTLLTGGVDKYAPFCKTIHFKDLTPKELKLSLKKFIDSFVEYLKSQGLALQGYVKSTTDPIVANTVSSVNPMLAPVNKTLETVIDQYLPTAETATPTTDGNEVTKFLDLTRDATGRTITVVQTTASKAMKLPSDISEHVSKIYGSELKEHQSIPSAIVHTSSELVSEVTTNLGLKQKATAATEAVESKVNGVIETTSNATAAVRDSLETVTTPNPQIQVGA